MGKKRKRPEPDADGILRTGIYERNVAPPPRATAKEIEAAIVSLESLRGLPRGKAPSKPAKPPALAQPRPSIRDWFNQWRSGLAEVIRPHVALLEILQPHLSYKSLDIGDGYRWYALSADAPEEVRDAIDAMNGLRVLEHHVGEDDTLTPQGQLAWVVQFAYRFGRIVERMEVRPFEPLVAESLARKPGQRKGAAIVNADHAELHSQYQSEVASLMATGMKYYPAADEVGQKLGVSGKTVRKYAPNPAKSE